MLLGDVVLLLVNLVYATSYVATRVVLDHVPPATLALLRLAGGTILLAPVAHLERRRYPRPRSRADRGRLVLMGVLGFAGAFALANWGIARSTATNAALLITVEPITVILLSPVLLGERLTRREGLGAALSLIGATLVVVNGVPGLTETVVPRWQGDVLLLLSGVAYASYSLLGREVLARHRALPVTASSIGWGAVATVPLATLEWGAGQTPRWTAGAVGGTLYLTLVITVLGYLAWNWALERVPAPRAAVFLNLQPLVGALLGVAWLGEPLSVFTVAGGALVVGGLMLTARSGPAG